ncbi:SWIB/MDM2 domain-containing protein [Periconia macrospinosa]|uniref:SWIB/MDM2 domain-containing protein n=1 Tax=Periconia macrospinosa TaxID=97972 RepID=A0A2V1DDA4_9PLEO|nr:SWIB/MDM2 domain-containing protein [Periconia macrospinosa]
MAALSPQTSQRYSAIIDSILANSDLNTISAKRIRKGLQERLDHDISDQKNAITDLIMLRFDRFNAAQNGVPESEPPVTSVEALPTTNGNHTSPSKKRGTTEDDESALSELENSPPKKKYKKVRTTEDEDAAFAAKLQAEENLRGRARSTRGGNTKKKAPIQKQKKTKKKSSNRVKDEDDSDIGSGSGAEKKSPNRKGGFHKPMALSQPLSDLLGETQLSRPQTVKKIWEYVKMNDLQDPNDKRQIRCDDAMRAVFKQDRVHMFTMNKILNQNLYAVDEIVE